MSPSHTTDGGDRTSKNYDCQNFQLIFTGVPVHISHVFSGVPKISSRVSREYSESPSLKTESRKTGWSGDANILRLISSVSGSMSNISCLLLSHISHLISHISHVTSCVSHLTAHIACCLTSHISYFTCTHHIMCLTSHGSHLTSRVSCLMSHVSNLTPFVAYPPKNVTVAEHACSKM